MNAIKKIIFLGGLWDNDEEVIRISKGSVQFAANAFQKNIIRGLDQAFGSPTTIVTGLFIGSYPTRCDQLKFASSNFNHSEFEGHLDYKVGFCNLSGIKHFSMAHSLKKKAEALLRSEKSVEGICICAYAMTYSTVTALTELKSKFPEVCTCLIVPDLPQYMNLGAKKRRLRSAVKSLVNRRLLSMIQNIDCFTVLTKFMPEKLGIENKPYCVVEGIAPYAESVSDKDALEKNSIVYTGSLDEKYGIVDLVDSFCSLNRDDLYLDIYGHGDSIPYIMEKSKSNLIRFWGNVENDVARKAQQDALLLVNPRKNSEEYTKYSFPSKTLEYMSSGTAVLMCRLPGVPEEYYEHVFTFEEDLQDSLKKVTSLPKTELVAKGLEGKDFAFKYKNAAIQS